MRKFQVTVNGNIYEVEVEEVGASASTSAPVARTSAVQAPSTPAAAPKAAPTAPVSAPAAAPASGSVGSTLLEAPMIGKIVGVKVTAGQTVKAGDVIAILEAMKMENELVAPKEGTVVSVNVTVGQQVDAGDLIASLN